MTAERFFLTVTNEKGEAVYVGHARMLVLNEGHLTRWISCGHCGATVVTEQVMPR